LRLLSIARDGFEPELGLLKSWGERQRFAIGVGGLLELALFFQRRAQGEIGQGIRRSLYSFFVLHSRLFVPALFCQEPAESYAMASGTGIEGNRFLEILLRIGQRPLLHFEHRQIVVDLRRGSRFSGIAQRLPIIKFGFVEFLLLQVDGANLEKRGVVG